MKARMQLELGIFFSRRRDLGVGMCGGGGFASPTCLDRLAKAEEEGGVAEGGGGLACILSSFSSTSRCRSTIVCNHVASELQAESSEIHQSSPPPLYGASELHAESSEIHALGYGRMPALTGCK